MILSLSERYPVSCGEVISMVTYTELFAYTLVLAAVITLVVKIKK